MIERSDASLAAHRPADVLSMFEWLGPAIEADAAAGLFSAWGRSSIVDENVGAPVLPRELFDALHERAGLASAWPVGNAGLLHVYGYLLSTVPTPYGLKRERWLDGALAEACGLTPDAFLPWVGERTLLARVTAAADELFEAASRRDRLDGGVVALTAIGPRRGSASALAYALELPARPRALITLFPVADPAALTSQLDAEPRRLRYNAAPSPF